MNNFHYHQDPLYSAASSILEGTAEVQAIVADFAVGDNTNFGKVLEIGADSITFKAKDLPKTKIAFKQRKMGSSEFLLTKLIKLKEETEASEETVDEAYKPLRKPEDLVAELQSIIDAPDAKLWDVTSVSIRVSQEDIFDRFPKIYDYVEDMWEAIMTPDGARKTKEIAKKAIEAVHKYYPIKEESEETLDEAINWLGDYLTTSEKSRFGGYRPTILDKKTKRVMYQSAAAYNTPEEAKDHAEDYLKQKSKGIKNPKVPVVGTYKSQSGNKNHNGTFGLNHRPSFSDSEDYGLFGWLGETEEVTEAIDPALKRRKQLDMARVNAGAMSRDEYNKKYKVGKYSSAGNKLSGPGGLYKNLVKKEALNPDDEASVWIDDFVKSDDPRFEGKSKEERIKMALGAWYAAQKKESTKPTTETLEESEMIEVETQQELIKIIKKDSVLKKWIGKRDVYFDGTDLVVGDKTAMADPIWDDGTVDMAELRKMVQKNITSYDQILQDAKPKSGETKVGSFNVILPKELKGTFGGPNIPLENPRAIVRTTTDKGNAIKKLLHSSKEGITVRVMARKGDVAAVYIDAKDTQGFSNALKKLASDKALNEMTTLEEAVPLPSVKKIIDMVDEMSPKEYSNFLHALADNAFGIAVSTKRVKPNGPSNSDAWEDVADGIRDAAKAYDARPIKMSESAEEETQTLEEGLYPLTKKALDATFNLDPDEFEEFLKELAKNLNNEGDDTGYDEWYQVADHIEKAYKIWKTRDSNI